MTEPTLEDRVLIRELYDRMVWALNTGDADTIRALHHPQMETDRWDHSRSGVDQVAAAAAAWPDDPVNSTRQHHITTFIVDADPEGRDDHRAVRFYFVVTEVKEPPRIDVRWSCYSRDIVRRVDGRWVIWQRDIKLNHDGTA
jgi:hypothetical protein